MRIVNIGESKITFNNGYILNDYHQQNCCEEVYADFKYLKNANILSTTGEDINIYDVEFPNYITKLIQGVDGMGFNLVAIDGSKFFVPCYNEQNGYYSDVLKLELTNEREEKEIIDITYCNQDKIY